VNTVAVSEYDGLQQALLLLSEVGQFVTGAGVWHISKQSGMERLQLITDREHWA
jgi:hypothetical protein